MKNNRRSFDPGKVVLIDFWATWCGPCREALPLDGSIAKLFNVSAIPATFTIDTDGVLEDQHVGDADIDGKLKKLIARANEFAGHKPSQQVADKPPADTN